MRRKDLGIPPALSPSVAKTSAIPVQKGRARVRRRGTGLAMLRRGDELLAQAHAMLEAGPSFWRHCNVSCPGPNELRDTIEEVRAAECAFCTALTMRLQVIVERQAPDREAWEFLAAAREALKKPLGSEWTPEWAAMGFAERALRIPARLEERITILHRVLDLLRSHPEHENAATNLTGERALRISRGLESARREIEECRDALRKAAQARRAAVQKLEAAIRSIVHQARAELRRRNPRWMPMTLEPCAREAPPLGSTAAVPPANDPQLQLLAFWAKPEFAAARLKSFFVPSRPGLHGRGGRFPKAVCSEATPGSQAPELKLASLLAWLLPPSDC